MREHRVRTQTKDTPSAFFGPKSDSDNGIDLHADEAVVKVNCWITRDEADLDPKSGGPWWYWEYRIYNSNTALVNKTLLKPTN